MEEMGLREETTYFSKPIVFQPLAYLDKLERGSPKANDDVRSENGLGPSELEEEVTLARGKKEEEPNIRCDGWFYDRHLQPVMKSAWR